MTSVSEATRSFSHVQNPTEPTEELWKKQANDLYLHSLIRPLKQKVIATEKNIALIAEQILDGKKKLSGYLEKLPSEVRHQFELFKAGKSFKDCYQQAAYMRFLPEKTILRREFDTKLDAEVKKAVQMACNLFNLESNDLRVNQYELDTNLSLINRNIAKISEPSVLDINIRQHAEFVIKNLIERKYEVGAWLFFETRKKCDLITYIEIVRQIPPLVSDTDEAKVAFYGKTHQDVSWIALPAFKSHANVSQNLFHLYIEQARSDGNFAWHFIEVPVHGEFNLMDSLKNSCSQSLRRKNPFVPNQLLEEMSPLP